jgi:tripartite-type tricarboxylate transporter receptor subunit TctC
VKKTLVGPILLALLLGWALNAHAQDYPHKPIKIIVPVPPGGGADRIARLVADGLQKKLGQPVIVENRSGAAGNIGADGVAKAAPDGYTLLASPPGPLVVNKSLYPKLSYDSDAFVPVSLMATTPFVLVVPPKLAAENLQQLIAFAKANPDRLNYASGGPGTTSHLAAELFKSMAGVKIVHVPYKGTGPALTDLLGGQVEMLFLEFGTALQYVRTGKLRALAVGGAKRNPLLPDVPAVAEQLPGFVAVTWHGMVAPPKTPPAIANLLSHAVAETLQQPEVAKRLLDLSIDAVGSTPAEMTQFVRQEDKRWGNVIRVTGTAME